MKEDMSRRVKAVSPTLRRFFQNREGVSEIVGGVMLIIILMFFFTNVYLWHDQATRQMNDVLSTKMNSPVSIAVAPSGNLVVTNNGGVDVGLSRLWIISDSLHLFADFEILADNQPWVRAGSSTEIDLNSSAPATYMSPVTVTWNNDKKCAVIQYAVSGNTTFRIVTANGNFAACSVSNVNSQLNNGNISTGAVVIADFQNFNYTFTSGSNPFTVDLTSWSSGNFVNSNGKNITFGVVLTNMDPQKRNITLNNKSQLLFIYGNVSGAVGTAVFYVANVTKNGNLGTIQPTYDDPGIELSYNVPTPVYFAAKNPVAGSPSFVPVAVQGATGVCPLNIALLGTIDTKPFGQNIPFISIYVNN